MSKFDDLDFDELNNLDIDDFEDLEEFNAEEEYFDEDDFTDFEDETIFDSPEEEAEALKEAEEEELYEDVVHMWFPNAEDDDELEEELMDMLD